MQSWGEGWECPAQEFCSCLLAAGVTLMQSLAEPTTPPSPAAGSPASGAGHSCASCWSQIPLRSSAGRDSHSRTREKGKSYTLRWGARNHLGSSCKMFSLQSMGERRKGTGRRRGEQICLQPTLPVTHPPSL